MGGLHRALVTVLVGFFICEHSDCKIRTWLAHPSSKIQTKGTKAAAGFAKVAAKEKGFGFTQQSSRFLHSEKSSQAIADTRCQDGDVAVQVLFPTFRNGYHTLQHLWSSLAAGATLEEQEQKVRESQREISQAVKNNGGRRRRTRPLCQSSMGSFDTAYSCSDPRRNRSTGSSRYRRSTTSYNDSTNDGSECGYRGQWWSQRANRHVAQSHGHKSSSELRDASSVSFVGKRGRGRRHSRQAIDACTTQWSSKSPKADQGFKGQDRTPGHGMGKVLQVGARVVHRTPWDVSTASTGDFPTTQGEAERACHLAERDSTGISKIDGGSRGRRHCRRTSSRDIANGPPRDDRPGDEGCRAGRAEASSKAIRQENRSHRSTISNKSVKDRDCGHTIEEQGWQRSDQGLNHGQSNCCKNEGYSKQRQHGIMKKHLQNRALLSRDDWCTQALSDVFGYTEDNSGLCSAQVARVPRYTEDNLGLCSAGGSSISLPLFSPRYTEDNLDLCSAVSDESVLEAGELHIAPPRPKVGFYESVEVCWFDNEGHVKNTQMQLHDSTDDNGTSTSQVGSDECQFSFGHVDNVFEQTEQQSGFAKYGMSMNVAATSLLPFSEEEDLISRQQFWAPLESQLPWTCSQSDKSDFASPCPCDRWCGVRSSLGVFEGRNEAEYQPPQLMVDVPFDQEAIDTEDETSEGDNPVTIEQEHEVRQAFSVASQHGRNQIHVVTFGLSYASLGRRDFDLDFLQIMALRVRIWEVWQDAVPQWEDIRVHMVRPQPWSQLGAPNALIVVVEITGFGHEHFPHPILALQTTMHNELVYSPQARYCRDRLNRSRLMKIFKDGSLCLPYGFRLCRPIVANRELQATNEAPVSNGALVQLMVDDAPHRFAMASIWCPAIEQLAIEMNRDFEDGQQVFTLALVYGTGTVSRCPMSYDDVIHPERMLQLVQRHTGYVTPVVHFTLLQAIDSVVVADPFEYFCFVQSERSDDETAVLVVTQRQQADGELIHVGLAIRTWTTVPSLASMHHGLCQQHGFPAEGTFAFFSVTQKVDDFRSFRSGHIVVHVMQELHADGIITPMAQSEAHGEGTDATLSDDSMSGSSHIGRQIT